MYKINKTQELQKGKGFQKVRYIFRSSKFFSVRPGKHFFLILIGSLDYNFGLVQTIFSLNETIVHERRRGNGDIVLQSVLNANFPIPFWFCGATLTERLKWVNERKSPLSVSNRIVLRVGTNCSCNRAVWTVLKSTFRNRSLGDNLCWLFWSPQRQYLLLNSCVQLYLYFV